MRRWMRVPGIALSMSCVVAACAQNPASEPPPPAAPAISSALLRSVVCAELRRCAPVPEADADRAPLYLVTYRGWTVGDWAHWLGRLDRPDTALIRLGWHPRAPFDSVAAAGLVAAVCQDAHEPACQPDTAARWLQVGTPGRDGTDTLHLVVGVVTRGTPGRADCRGYMQETVWWLRPEGERWVAIRSHGYAVGHFDCGPDGAAEP